MFRRSAVFATGLLLLSLIACTRPGNEAQTDKQQPAAQPAAAQQPPAQAQPAEPAPKPEEPAQPASRPAGKPAPASPTYSGASAAKPESRPAGAAPQGVAPSTPPAAPSALVQTPPPAPPKPIVVPSGTRFEVRLLDPISSGDNKSGDTFKAELDKDLLVDGKVAAPRGSTVTGKLLGVKASGRVEGRATMSVTLTEITIGNTPYPIQTNTLSFEAEKTTKQDVTKVGIGAGVGAIIGAIAGGGKGAAIGAAVGGGAGTATVLATKGKEVKFALEDKFSFVLRSDLSVKQ